MDNHEDYLLAEEASHLDDVMSRSPESERERQSRALEIYREAQKSIFGLAGDSNRDLRQSLMLAFTGQKLPKAKCGVHALYEAARALDPTITER